jgi:hypothetical protein
MTAKTSTSKKTSMKPFSPEWYAREQAWADKCQAGYDTLAAKLASDGWERHNRPGNIIPATFHKGTQVVYLARQLGSSKWFTKDYDL